MTQTNAKKHTNHHYIIKTNKNPSREEQEGVVTFVRTNGNWDTNINDLILAFHRGPTAELFTAVDDRDKIIGTAALMQTRDDAYWVGNIMVALENRHCGVGSHLLKALLDSFHQVRARCQSPPSLNLLATREGECLYKKFDFTTMGDIHARVLIRPRLPPPHMDPANAAEVVTFAGDARHQRAVAFYNGVVGTSRTVLLNRLCEMDGLCAVMEAGGEVSAAAWGRFYEPFDEPPGTCGVFIGPVVGCDDHSVRAVIAQILRAAEQRLRDGDGGSVPLVGTLLWLAFKGLKGEAITADLGFFTEMSVQYMGLNDSVGGVGDFELLQVDQRRYFGLINYDLV